MESFSNNRYQLLFVDDEDSDVRKINMQKAGGGDGGGYRGDQKMTKRNKMTVSKKSVQPIPSAGMMKRKSGLDQNPQQVKIANAKGAGDAVMPVQCQLEQPLDQQMDLMPEQRQQYKERSGSSRITSSSSSIKGLGYGNTRLFKAKFDRHSGSDKTGIKPMVKRNGGGAHNWGSVIEEIEVQSIAMKSDSSNEQLPQKNQQQPQQQQQQQRSVAIDADDTKYITVEEWRAKNEKRVKPVYNIRKAGEGELNKPDWNKMTVLPKKKPQKLEPEYLENDLSLYPQRVGRLHRLTNIEFKFKDDRRRSGGFAAWMAARSMHKPDGEHVSHPINVDDVVAFPTLG